MIGGWLFTAYEFTKYICHFDYIRTPNDRIANSHHVIKKQWRLFNYHSPSR